MALEDQAAVMCLNRPLAGTTSEISPFGQSWNSVYQGSSGLQAIDSIFRNRKVLRVSHASSRTHASGKHSRSLHPLAHKSSDGNSNNFTPTRKRNTVTTTRNCFCGILSTINFARYAPRKEAGMNSSMPHRSMSSKRTPLAM